MRFRFPYLLVLITPYILYSIGAFMNVLVVSTNRGYMPVAMGATLRTCPGDALSFIFSPPSSRKKDKEPTSDSSECSFPDRGAIVDEGHTAMQSSDHLKFLADWIQLPHQQGELSPGDLFMDLGNFLMWPLGVFWLALLWRDYNPSVR